MQTDQLAPISILRLFETSKTERGDFVTQIIERLDSGDVDPLNIHLQVKCMEDVIKQLNGNESYKTLLLDAAEKQEAKSFTYHNAKFEIKEVGVKYNFENCNDPVLAELKSKLEDLQEQVKQRETFLKTVPQKGLVVITDDGEPVTVYPPSKSSTTSVAVTLK